MATLLSSVDQIDAAWMQSVFDSAGKNIPTIGNVRIESLGDGKTGTTVKAVLEYVDKTLADSQAAPGSVVCKFHPTNPIVFEVVKDTGYFIAEAKMLKLLAERSDARVPESYFVAVANDGGEFNLVCEDLSDICELSDQVTGCSADDARTAILELAKFHRQFWNEPLLDTIDWTASLPNFLDTSLEQILARLSSFLPVDQYDVIKQTIPRIRDWLEFQPGNRTLLHKDCKVDNILFDHRNADEPKAYLIDFAMVGVGDAASDIAYFLTSSLSPKDRLACELDLLKLHTEEIAKKDPSYTFSQAVQAYQDNIVSSLYTNLYVAVNIPETPEAQLLMETLYERNCAAVRHWLN